MNKLIFSFFFVSSVAMADDDMASMAEYSKAVEQAQQGLMKPNERQQMINTPNAKEADARVKDVTGGNKMDQEAIYKLSSQILGEVKGNDSEALKKALMKAQGDPQAFMQSLSPELQKQIRELAGRIEDRQKKKP